MRPFDELDPPGRTRRLVAAGRRALQAHYGLRPIWARPQRPTWNRIVKVGLADGRIVAVRIGAPTRVHPAATEAVEARWLAALALHPELGAPVLLPTVDGRPSVTLTDPGLDRPRDLTVFTWVPGRRVARPIGVRPAHRLGVLAARLHIQAPQVAIPASWQQECRADDPITFAPVDGLNRLRAPHRSLVHDALQRCRGAIGELWQDPPHPPHLLHGDLGPHNVLAEGPRLRPVDFQDVVWGFDVLDLGITLADFGRHRTAVDAVDAFRTGYRTVRPWPDVEPHLWAALDAARSLNLINLGLSRHGPEYDPSATPHLAILRRWMAS